VVKRRAASGCETAAKTNRGGLEAPADGNGEGRDNNSNEGDKESKGNKGEGKEGNDPPPVVRVHNHQFLRQ
jgi:hypothetical protein